jgi:ubiquitin C-terminal hydrolase
MNSILASMSHCVPLTDYFLDDVYKRDLNRDNPLGWGGRVAEEYAGLLHEIWSDKYKVVAPRGFKAIIAEFQPRFEGYAQHDPSELLQSPAKVLNFFKSSCISIL